MTISCKGQTLLPLLPQVHYDQTQIVNCLLRGEKRWLFFDTREPEVHLYTDR